MGHRLYKWCPKGCGKKVTWKMFPDRMYICGKCGARFSSPEMKKILLKR